MEREQAIELAKYFFAEIRKEDVSTVADNEKINSVARLERLDMEPSMFLRVMIDYSAYTTTIPRSIDDILSVHRRSLTQSGIFYYHPRLQVASPPPTLRQLDSGEFVEVDTGPFFLRNTTIFTTEQAGEYFHQGMRTKSMVKNRDTASIKKLLEYCENNLDLLLYTIDAAARIILDEDKRPPKSPVFLTDYIDEGQWLLEERITLCKAVGMSHEYDSN